MLHLLQFTEVGIPLLAAIFLEINAGIIAFMFVMFLVHEATAFWDVSYSVTRRNVTPVEQHIHNFLELIPLMAIVCVVALHWTQFQALFDFGNESAEFTLAWRAEPLPVLYVLILMAFIVVMVVIPFIEELLRCLRAMRTAKVPSG